MTACPPWTPCHTQTSYLESHPWTRDIKGCQGAMLAPLYIPGTPLYPWFRDIKGCQGAMLAELGQHLAPNRYSKTKWMKEGTKWMWEEAKEKVKLRSWLLGLWLLLPSSYLPISKLLSTKSPSGSSLSRIWFPYKYQDLHASRSGRTSKSWFLALTRGYSLGLAFIFSRVYPACSVAIPDLEYWRHFLNTKSFLELHLVL